MPGEQQPLSRVESVVWRRIGENAVLVEMGEGEVFELEGPAVRIWELLEHRPTLDRLIERLEDEYEVDGELLRADTERTLAELAAANLLA